MDELRVAQERELGALQRATEMGRWPRRNRRSASAEQRQNDAPERLTDHGLGAYRTAPTRAPRGDKPPVASNPTFGCHPGYARPVDLACSGANLDLRPDRSDGAI